MNNLSKRFFFFFILGIPALLIILLNFPCNNDDDFKFEKKLSAYKLFKKGSSDLILAANIFPLELKTSLFSDFAEKDRGVRLPIGKKILMLGNGDFQFPSGTILFKTFFYANSLKGKKLVETRLLILDSLEWKGASYIWGDSQSDADLLTKADSLNIGFKLADGNFRKINYHIPSKNDCRICHSSDGRFVPIGTNGVNLNIPVIRNGKHVNQLKYLRNKGGLAFQGDIAFGNKPAYSDTAFSLAKRARSYLDMNCAHCHNPKGTAMATSLNLTFNVSLSQTGILLHKRNIIERMSFMNSFHMPKIGTTVIDTSGVALVIKFITSLPKDI